MIELTKIDGTKILVNADEIESVESNYDTIVNLKSGKKIIVKDSQEQIKIKFIKYKQECNSHSIINQQRQKDI